MAKKSSGSSADTIIKLVLIFFISLLSFSVGTFVGKQVSDADYRKAAIEGDYGHFQADNDHKQAEEGLSEDDIASLTEEFVNTEKRGLASTDHDKKKHASGHQADNHKKEEHAQEKAHASDHHADSHKDEHTKEDSHAKEKPHNSHEEKSADAHGYKKYGKAVPSEHMAEKTVAQKHNIDEHKSHAIDAAAQRVAAGKAPAEDHHESRKPTSVLPGVASSSVGKYTVQVASYAEEAEAKAHSAKLKSKGWNAFYIPADIKGRTWYRVSVGLFSTTASAEKFKAELKKEANISSAYVQKIVQ